MHPILSKFYYIEHSPLLGSAWLCPGWNLGEASWAWSVSMDLPLPHLESPLAQQPISPENNSNQQEQAGKGQFLLPEVALEKEQGESTVWPR